MIVAAAWPGPRRPFSSPVRSCDGRIACARLSGALPKHRSAVSAVVTRGSRSRGYDPRCTRTLHRICGGSAHCCWAALSVQGPRRCCVGGLLLLEVLCQFTGATPAHTDSRDLPSRVNSCELWRVHTQDGHRRRMPARSARIRAARWTDEALECPVSASRPCARLDSHCAARAPQRWRARGPVSAPRTTLRTTMPTTSSKAPRAPRVPALNPNEERPEDCYCSALPRGSGPCLPCYVRQLRLAEASRQRSRPG